MDFNAVVNEIVTKLRDLSTALPNDDPKFRGLMRAMHALGPLLKVKFVTSREKLPESDELEFLGTDRKGAFIYKKR